MLLQQIEAVQIMVRHHCPAPGRDGVLDVVQHLLGADQIHGLAQDADAFALAAFLAERPAGRGAALAGGQGDGLGHRLGNSPARLKTG